MPNWESFKEIPARHPWMVVSSVLIRDYVEPGWNRRDRHGRLQPISGWRLVLHRILWGFNRLVDVEDAQFTPFTRDGLLRGDLEALGFHFVGALKEPVHA